MVDRRLTDPDRLDDVISIEQDVKTTKHEVFRPAAVADNLLHALEGQKTQRRAETYPERLVRDVRLEEGVVVAVGLGARLAQVLADPRLGVGERGFRKRVVVRVHGGGVHGEKSCSGEEEEAHGWKFNSDVFASANVGGPFEKEFAESWLVVTNRESSSPSSLVLSQRMQLPYVCRCPIHADNLLPPAKYIVNISRNRKREVYVVRGITNQNS